MTVMRNRPAAAAILFCLLLGGCATRTDTRPAEEQGATDTTPADPRSPVESSADQASEQSQATRPSADSATLALLQQSERALENGSIHEALSYAERAVRIDPRSAPLWTRLAALELSAGNPASAIQFATKALTLASNRPDWQRNAWLVIADAREAMGETERAQAIRAEWQTGRG